MISKSFKLLFILIFSFIFSASLKSEDKINIWKNENKTADDKSPSVTVSPKETITQPKTSNIPKW